jgi:RHS repeat-associated protein
VGGTSGHPSAVLPRGVLNFATSFSVGLYLEGSLRNLTGNHVTDPVLSDGTASYTPGVSRRTGTETRYLHTGLKNTDSLTNPGQTVAAARIYDAFGNVTSSSGTWSGPFGYAGNFGYQADASGLKLMGHRYYDPSTGRFLTRDPIKDGRNWYAYGAGEAAPTNIADPTGLAWHDPVWVEVDPEFKGTVIAYGDFEWRKDDHWRDTAVLPGYRTDPRMDVDMISVTDEKGNQTWYWLPGRMKGQGSSGYYVDRRGRVVPRSGAFRPRTSFEFGLLSVIAGFLLCSTPGLIGGAVFYDNTSKRWWDWIWQAQSTGFPKGYEPQPVKPPKGGGRRS